MNTPATSNSADYSGEQIAYKDSTYELVSKVAFLIGVPQRIFENEHEAPQLDVFNRLSKDKNARIIRNLCIIRTSIERNFKKSTILCERITADFCPCRKSSLPNAFSSSARTESLSSKNPAPNFVIILLKLIVLSPTGSITAKAFSRYGLIGRMSKSCL